MWRTLLLAVGYVPWLFATMVLAFAVMYLRPVVIPAVLVSGWLMLYGALSYLWLVGRTRAAPVQALLVPVPVALFMFFSELEQTGLIERSMAWLLDVPIHALGVALCALILRHRRKR